MYNEMFADDRSVRGPYEKVAEWINAAGVDLLKLRQSEAEAIFRKIGITFAVYGEGGDPERLIPFDLIPRVFGASEWRRLSRGIKQRSRALNAFLYDVYHRGEILRAGIIPEELVYQNEAFLPDMIGVDPPGRVYSHIVGVDIVRTDGDKFQVLEDNCRTPSGVSYMLENREITKRVFPELFTEQSILPVDAYPERLRRILASLSPQGDQAVIGVLTPGIYNSAYFEHSFLARQMGAELVEGRDLFVEDEVLYMRTIHGPVRVDVLYRRVDDAFLDPEVFRPDSALGTPGLMAAWRAGNLALANAPGTGVADDKAVYAYVPDMIRYYLNQEPILSNVPTYQCGRDEDRAYVLDHLDELVVKPANESGGYGIIIGPKATAEELEQCAKEIRNDPRGFVAQPVIDLSVVPTLCDGELAPRHVDLRPFTLLGAESYVTCGGLTRVAMVEGSLVVNSSQGGGSKDTWVVDTDAVAASPVSTTRGRSTTSTAADQSQSQSQTDLPHPQGDT